MSMRSNVVSFYSAAQLNGMPLGGIESAQIFGAPVMVLVAHSCYNCDTFSQQGGTTSKESHT
jgi:hypothetical protein